MNPDQSAGLRLAAHDLNNLCARIIGFAVLAADDAPPNSELAEHLNAILLAADEIVSIADRLRDFSQHCPPGQLP